MEQERENVEETSSNVSVSGSASDSGTQQPSADETDAAAGGAIVRAVSMEDPAGTEDDQAETGREDDVILDNESITYSTRELPRVEENDAEETTDVANQQSVGNDEETESTGITAGGLLNRAMDFIRSASQTAGASESIPPAEDNQSVTFESGPGEEPPPEEDEILELQSSLPDLSKVVDKAEEQIQGGDKESVHAEDEDIQTLTAAEEEADSVSEKDDSPETDFEVKHEGNQAAPAARKVSEVLEHVNFEARTLAGKKFALNKVHLDSTIWEVKQMVSKMDGKLTPNEIKLIKGGKPLSDDSQTIRDIGIVNGDVLHCVKKLFGANKSQNKSEVGVRHERTEEKDRGMIKITIPAGARPGNRLILQPPGRPRMHITVPRGYQPGMVLNVKLPDEEPAAARPTHRMREDPQSPASDQPTRRDIRGINPGGSNLLKARCPANATPGTEIEINVPGSGRMKVQVPAQTRPGQDFYFRLMDTY